MSPEWSYKYSVIILLKSNHLFIINYKNANFNLVVFYLLTSWHCLTAGRWILINKFSTKEWWNRFITLLSEAEINILSPTQVNRERVVSSEVVAATHLWRSYRHTNTLVLYLMRRSGNGLHAGLALLGIRFKSRGIYSKHKRESNELESEKGSPEAKSNVTASLQTHLVLVYEPTRVGMTISSPQEGFPHNAQVFTTIECGFFVSGSRESLHTL